MIAFPVLQVSGDSIASFPDESAFRRAVGLTTDKAIADGFFKRARLIDASLVEHRVKSLRLAASGLLGWMQRARRIETLDIERVGELDLAGVKALIARAIRTSALWSESGEAAEVLDAVERAGGVDEIAALFLMQL